MNSLQKLRLEQRAERINLRLLIAKVKDRRSVLVKESAKVRSEALEEIFNNYTNGNSDSLASISFDYSSIRYRHGVSDELKDLSKLQVKEGLELSDLIFRLKCRKYEIAKMLSVELDQAHFKRLLVL